MSNLQAVKSILDAIDSAHLTLQSYLARQLIQE
jgi:hypothetical protein